MNESYNKMMQLYYPPLIGNLSHLFSPVIMGADFNPAFSIYTSFSCQMVYLYCSFQNKLVVRTPPLSFQKNSTRSAFCFSPFFSFTSHFDTQNFQGEHHGAATGHRQWRRRGLWLAVLGVKLYYCL